jgi:hypothetical protein
MNSNGYFALWVLIQFFVMDTILSSPDSAPLSYVMICWNAVANTVNMFVDELFALGAWTDWLGTYCWLCLKVGGTYFSHCGFIYLWLYSSSLGLGYIFSFLVYYTIGRTLLTADQPIVRPLPTQDNTNRINAHRNPCLKWFESKVSVFKRATTVHALDITVTMIGTVALKTDVFQNNI